MVRVAKNPARRDPLVEACVEALLHADSSLRVEVGTPSARGQAQGPKVESITLRTSGGRHTYLLRLTRSHLSYALASGLIEARAPGSKGTPTLLFAPYVPPRLGQYLRDHHVNYADAVGNCHVMLGPGRLLVHVEGKKPSRDISARSGGRAPGHQLLFAILAAPELLQQPVRAIAVAAGLGKSAVARHLDYLVAQGLVERTRSRIAIARPQDLLDRWLLAYEQSVRPAWLLGRYRTADPDPVALERSVINAWPAVGWAFGGGAAAWRMTHSYRGTETVLHVATMEREMIRSLRMLPSADGPIAVLRTPGTLAYNGSAPQLAHPLLVYTEMLAAPDPRMLEAATDLRERFLELPQ